MPNHFAAAHFHLHRHPTLTAIGFGFAAETKDLIKNAKLKVEKKHCDWIIANDISRSDIGFDSEFNEVSIIYKNKVEKRDFFSKRSKSEIAEEITNKIIENFVN